MAPAPSDPLLPTIQNANSSTGSIGSDSPTKSPSRSRDPILPSSLPSQSSNWRTWPELTLRIDNLPLNVTTQDLCQWLSSHGEIASLDVFSPRSNADTMSSKVTFEPPPRHAFWDSGVLIIHHPDKGQYPWGLQVKVAIAPDTPQDWWVSRVCPDRKYPARIIATSTSLAWGAMVGPSTMNIRETLPAFNGNTVKLDVDVRSKRFTVYFAKLTARKQVRQFKFVTSLSQIQSVFHTSSQDGRDYLVMPLPLPPQYFCKSNHSLKIVSNDCARRNAKADVWLRTIDLAHAQYGPPRVPIALHNDSPDPGDIEIGRWTTFRLCLKHETDEEERSIRYLRMALEDFNIKVLASQDFKITRHNETMWDHLNHPPIVEGESAAALLRMHSSSFIHLEFNVRYQLEVCVSRGILNEHTISTDFLEKLAALNPSNATRRLEFLMDRGKILYNPMDLFDWPEAQHYSAGARIPSYCALIRRASITPTTIRFSSPIVEASNRVIRHYSHVQDRFLRVQFIEESENGRMTINTDQNGEIWQRLIRTMYHGIRIGDRIYEFLAFGSSQLRQCGAYFFCPTQQISCDDIRRWMGNFNHIRVIAKYAARLGQCFSTTRELRGIPVPSIKPIPDIERNGHCFTDGCGIISGFLAQLVTEELTLDIFSEPSAFQFRMGGCKGVLAVWPQAKGQEVYIRDSQEKFKTRTNNLEIIRCAKFANATLNRQTITILECLGVPVKAFMDLLNSQIHLYEKAMTSNTTAVDLLTKFVDENQSTLVLAEFLRAGFKTQTFQEPFVINLLRLWRAWSLRLLKEKARIQIEKSAFVLGCVDETGTLRGHSNQTEGSRSKDVDKLPQIFLQLTDPEGYDETNIVQGVCIVGRNPSLHPGDIRVVEAVDSPRLRHLKDVVVFPSTGDRPVPSMLSGGDLDGDDFFIIWEPSLIPKEWNHPPMDYAASKPLDLGRDVNVDDMRNFFVNYLKNDVLALIATSHLAFADIHGPKSPMCLHLASVHSKAVDFPKTGDPAEWDLRYNPRRWPHFMEKKSTYRSRKALGVIFDRVVQQEVQFSPDWGREFDQRVMNRFELKEAVLEEARGIKREYDSAVRRILSQHSVGTEFELYTAWAMSKPPIGSDYKRQEELGHEYDALKERFRDLCYEAAGGYSETEIDVFVAAMYKVTEEEAQDYLREPDGRASMPLISFPWIFPWVMTRLASRRRYKPKKSFLARTGQRESVRAAKDVADSSGEVVGESSKDAFKESRRREDEIGVDPAAGVSDEPEAAAGHTEAEDQMEEEADTEPLVKSIEHELGATCLIDRLALFDEDD